jgi:hypothetical protein
MEFTPTYPHRNYPPRPNDMNPPVSPAQYVFRRPDFPIDNTGNEKLAMAITGLFLVPTVLVVLGLAWVLVGRRRRARLGTGEEDAWVLGEGEFGMESFSDGEEV